MEPETSMRNSISRGGRSSSRWAEGGKATTITSAPAPSRWGERKTAARGAWATARRISSTKSRLGSVCASARRTAVWPSRVALTSTGCVGLVSPDRGAPASTRTDSAMS